MTHHRFLQPVLPLLALLLGLGLMALPPARQRWLFVALGVLLVCQSPRLPLFARDLAGNSKLDHAHRSDANVAIARWLDRHLPPGKTIVADEIGALGFATRLRVMDVWGLADKKVARILHAQRFNPYASPPFSDKRTRVQRVIARELLGRDPDYVLLDYEGPVPATATAVDPRRINPVTMKQLFDEMADRYQFVRGFAVMTSPYKTFLLYARRGQDK